MTNQLQHQQRRPDYRIPAIEKMSYCLCLHVKPTTIFIAVFKLIRALLFASILLNTEFSVDQAPEFGLGVDDRHRSTAIAIHILARIVTAFVSAIAIYAVISGRAALLMPLYAMLLVELFFSLPAFYNRDLEPSMVDNMVDYRNSYGTNSNQYTRYSQMLISTITMIIKIYFLCVVYKCWRMLRLIELVSPIRLSEIYPHMNISPGPQYPIVRVLSNGDSTDLTNGAPPPNYDEAMKSLPPNYDEAMKSNTIFPANSVMNQQQTVVFTNLTEPHQNISTQVVNVDNISQNINSRTSSSIVHQGLNSSNLAPNAVESSTPNASVEDSTTARESSITNIPKADGNEVQRDIH